MVTEIRYELMQTFTLTFDYALLYIIYRSIDLPGAIDFQFRVPPDFRLQRLRNL